MTTPYIKGAANTHVAFLQKHSTLNPQGWKLRLKHHTCYVLHYFKFPPLLADILADIFLNMFLTSLPRHSLWTSFRHINIFWHSWHVLTILSDTFFLNFLQTYLLTFYLTYLVTSCNYFFDTLFLQLLPILSITVEVRHATLNSHDRSWGPARHTELAGSQLRSGTQYWTHEITVGVRHATLNSQDRGWGPARHTELAGSRLGSGTPHWTHRIATGGGRGRRTRRSTGGGEETDIKSNNPHLTGGEKSASSFPPTEKSLGICSNLSHKSPGKIGMYPLWN